MVFNEIQRGNKKQIFSCCCCYCASITTNVMRNVMNMNVNVRRVKWLKKFLPISNKRKNNGVKLQITRKKRNKETVLIVSNTIIFPLDKCRKLAGLMNNHLFQRINWFHRPKHVKDKENNENSECVCDRFRQTVCSGGAFNGL